MNRMILSLLMQNLMAGKAGNFRARKIGPLAGIFILPLFVLLAVVGLVGFAVLSVGLIAVSLVRSFLPRPKGSQRVETAEPTITVLDASGKTVATVPRGA